MFEIDYVHTSRMSWYFHDKLSWTGQIPGFEFLVYHPIFKHFLAKCSSWVSINSDRMAVGFTTTCAISAYHHLSCEFEPRSWQGVLDATLCDKVCQWLATGQSSTQVSSTNKTDRSDITEILLKIALNTIKLNQWKHYVCFC
jgi:hypothetical protein